MQAILKTKQLIALFLILALTFSGFPPVFDRYSLEQAAGNGAASSSRSQALRPELDTSGLEEALQSQKKSFIPWRGAPQNVLVRPESGDLRAKLPRYQLTTARHLQEILNREIQSYLRQTYGIEETPLVYFPGISRKFGKPVFLFRDALLPAGSSKPRMLAPLFDLYLHGDSENITGRRDRPRKPNLLATQSTGNHLLAMAWGGAQLRQHGVNVEVLGFTMRGIPKQKKEQANSFGAQIEDIYDDYQGARQAMLKRQEGSGDDFLYWKHGDRPIILGNMTAAYQLYEQIQRNPALKGARIVVVSPAGAGGRVAGMAAGLTQLSSQIEVVASETTRTRPAFEAVKVGHPVLIGLPAERIAEDGIAVDQVEEEALDVILQKVKAVASVESSDAIAYTHWLFEEMAQLPSADPNKPYPIQTEVVTGMSLATLFRYPGLFEGFDAVILDETGINIDPEDRTKVLQAPLPKVSGERSKSLITAGLEEGDGAASSKAALETATAGKQEKQVNEATAEIQWAIQEVGAIKALPPSDLSVAEERFVEIFHRMNAWNRDHRLIFDQLKPEDRNQFSQNLYTLLRHFEEKGTGRVIREGRDTQQGTSPRPILWEEGKPPILAGMSLNAALDIAVDPFVAEDGVKRLKFAAQGGGFMANMARATTAFGAPALLVLVRGGESGRELENSLLWDRVDVRVVDGGINFFTRVSWVLRQGQIRLTPPGPGYEGKPLVMEDAQDRLRGLLTGPAGYPYDWMVGEQFPDDRAARFQIKLIEGLKQLNRHVRVFIAPSETWSAETLTAILKTHPEVVSFTWPILAKFLKKEGAAKLQYPPEEIASEASQIRQHYQIQKVLVHPDQGIVVAVENWSGHIQPSLDWGYRVGRADFVTAHDRMAGKGLYTRDHSLAAATAAVMAGTLYRGHEVGGKPLLREKLEAALKNSSVRIAEWWSTPQQTSGGLEERFHLLEEGKIGRGVLVIPAQVIGQFTGLEELLRRLPPTLASSVVLSGEDPLADSLQRRNPELRVFHGGKPIDLAVYLAGLEEVDRVSVLGDSELAAGLEELMANFGIPIYVASWNLTFIFEALGVPGSVSQQVGLEELAGDLFRKRGA